MGIQYSAFSHDRIDGSPSGFSQEFSDARKPYAFYRKSGKYQKPRDPFQYTSRRYGRLDGL